MNGRGVTLIELLVVLAILGILAWLAVPAMSGITERTHATSRVNGLIALIRHARQSAIQQRRWVTLCPARDQSCTGSRDWATGIMSFADDNRDGFRQPAEAILAYQSRLDPGERLVWRSFRRKNYLQFRSEGYTNWQNGSFLYCPASGDARNGKILIINIQGRTAVSSDADGDGVDEQASGTPLTC